MLSSLPPGGIVYDDLSYDVSYESISSTTAFFKNYSSPRAASLPVSLKVNKLHPVKVNSSKTAGLDVAFRNILPGKEAERPPGRQRGRRRRRGGS